MSTSEISPPFAFRPLDVHDLEDARSVVDAVGVHGVYVRNALESDASTEDDQLFGLYGSEQLLGLVYFGSRGNLIVVERDPVDPQRIAARIRATGVEWRIALGRGAVIGALADLDRREPLVLREQHYYAIEHAESAVATDAVEARPAQRRDARALMSAALDLNDSDLNVAPWRVNRAWLRDTVRRRIREGRTFVTGPLGAPTCKLDIGSRGLAGAVIEGVYTRPEVRGTGLASALVAHVARAELANHPRVCLHVAADNAPARRAYERAGMQPAGTCQLLLRG